MNDYIQPDTMQALIRALGGDEEGIRHTIETCSEFCGRTMQEGAEMLLDVARNQSHEALETLSDEDVPRDVAAMAGNAASETGQPVTAVKRCDGGWRLHTTGNPITLESWFEQRGFRALADFGACTFWSK